MSRDKPIIFGLSLASEIFYLLPTIRYAWGECKCWKISLIWGNICFEVFTTCNPDWLNKI